VSDPDWRAAEEHIEALKKLNFFPVVLHVDDVHQMRRGLSDEEAMEALEYANRKIASWGLSQDDVEYALEELYGTGDGGEEDDDYETDDEE
jgi:hypothetical protein